MKLFCMPVLHGQGFKNKWSLITEVLKFRKNLQLLSAASLSKIHVRARMHWGDISSDAINWAKDERFPYLEVLKTFSMQNPVSFPLWFAHSDCCTISIDQSISPQGSVSKPTHIKNFSLITVFFILNRGFPKVFFLGFPQKSCFQAFIFFLQ